MDVAIISTTRKLNPFRNITQLSLSVTSTNAQHYLHWASTSWSTTLHLGL